MEDVTVHHRSCKEEKTIVNVVSEDELEKFLYQSLGRLLIFSAINTMRNMKIMSDPATWLT